MRCVNAPGFFLRLKNVVMKDYTPLWPYAARPLTNAVAEQFATRGTAGAHGGWAALSLRYLMRKYRQWGEQPILVASGAMEESFLSDDAFTYEPMRMTYGPRDPHLAEIAFYAQTGFRTRLGTGKAKSRGGSRTAPPDGKAFVEPRRVFDWTPQILKDVGRALAAGYVVICRRKGYAIWQQGMAVSEAPLQTISAAEARLAGKSFFADNG
jgi:hypothetical protein